ncbi:putative quinol monooxygenase [Mycolicibacterium porcinum]|uniref:Antibiotic biosynthesis monooxygenase n=1 Tax=Mycolicibacterium porcinum TaxID=39693 RepID=A0AAW5STQ5_9MYCO|nr:putative quinol monooxygenase [Mycolicibacterium porcinum]MCV7386480.1 antibiotic biosynthesis monooxygenase [Mycolicibacterium porcinum]
MAHIVVISRIQVKHGQREAALEALREEIEASHHEDGVVKFALHEDPEDALKLLMVEVYRAEEDIDSHYKQPYFLELVNRMGELFDGLPTADRFVGLPFGDPAKGQLA